MDKIPVGRTIAEAYGFAFGRFPGNLGVVWLPAALLMAAVWYVIPTYATSWIAMIPEMGSKPDPAAILNSMQQVYRAFILLWIALILLRAEMMLGLTRRALGMRNALSFVFLSIGKPFWRLSGAYFAVMIILWTAETVLVIGLIVVAFVAGGIGAILAAGDKDAIAVLIGVIGGVAGIGLFCALFYIAVRLTFLLTPLIVAEERFDLIRPWRLAGGNFWRIFAIGVAVFVPLMLLIAIVSVPVYIVALLPFPHLALSSQDPTAAAQNIQIFFAALLANMRAHWYLVVPLSLASSALIYGAAAGAAASAYRALVPQTEPPAVV
jgi:hypothetical protein